MLRGDPTTSWNFLRRESAEGGADVFCLVTDDEMCGNSTKMQEGKIRLEKFTLRMVRH